MKSFVKLLLPIVLASTLLSLQCMEPEERIIDSEDNVLFYAQDGELIAALHLGFVADQAPGIIQIIKDTGSQEINAVPHSPETVKFIINALIASDQPTFDKNNLKNTQLYTDLQNLTIKNLIAIGNCAVWARYEILQNAIALKLAEKCENSKMYSPASYMGLGLDCGIAERVTLQLDQSHNQQNSKASQTEVTIELADGQTITMPRSQAEQFSTLKNILAGLDDDKPILIPNSLSIKDLHLLFELAQTASTCNENDEGKIVTEAQNKTRDFSFDQINELLAVDYLGSELLISVFITILEEKLKDFVVSNDNTQLEHILPQCSPLFLDKMAQKLLNNKNLRLALKHNRLGQEHYSNAPLLL